MSDLVADSERMIAAILEELAKRGVKRDDLNLAHVGFEGSRENMLLFVDAMRWLEEEGVIRSNEKHKFMLSNGEALGFTLTSLGYRLLSQRFDGELTLGQAIQNTNSSGTGYANVGNLLGGLLGSFTKTLAN